MKFTRAIVRQPCRNMIHGLTNANLGVPDYQKAMLQHDRYVEALRKCGLAVTVLEPDNEYPDSTFVEDVALLTHRCAIITRPGAQSRRGETIRIEPVIRQYYQSIEYIAEPGTVDAGDVMMTGDHYFIGHSERTNKEGAAQLTAILEKYGLTASTIDLEKVLHLKTGVAYLEDNTLAATGELFSKKEFSRYRLIEIPEDESYAANCVWINGIILIADGYSNTRKVFERAGFKVLAIDVSEFRKLDGGLSCLSLRF